MKPNTFIIALQYSILIMVLAFSNALLSQSVLKNGIWRAVITRPDSQKIIFNFETKDSAGKQILYFINGTEQLLTDSIVIRNDSVFIQMPFFESDFAARIQQNGNLSGEWTKNFGQWVQRLPFSAEYNNPKRFEPDAPPRYNISGTWTVYFQRKDGRKQEAIGKFNQHGNYLTGTFLTITGDYRYLEGIVNDDSLLLSGFDGSHAFLFTAAINDNDSIKDGKWYIHATGLQDWTARRNENAVLPNEYSVTKLKDGAEKLNFTFKSVEGKMVSITDAAYKNKIIIVQLLGSWCSNCMDETRFLSNFYTQNKQKGVEIIGVAYEATTDYETSKRSLRSFMQRLQVTYPVLVTAITAFDSLKTEKTLPQLEAIKAFPTTIFIDKNGNVRKIHTGFRGPGTGEYYELFKKEFTDLIDSLLQEK